MSNKATSMVKVEMLVPRAGVGHAAAPGDILAVTLAEAERMQAAGQCTMCRDDDEREVTVIPDLDKEKAAQKAPQPIGGRTARDKARRKAHQSRAARKAAAVRKR